LLPRDMVAEFVRFELCFEVWHCFMFAEKIHAITK